MKNKTLLISIILIILFAASSCNDLDKIANSSTEENIKDNNKNELENLGIIPFEERRFIYSNGLSIEYSQESKKDNDTTIEKNYPQISGLINKETENKVNDSIKNNMELYAKELENYIKSNSNAEQITFEFISSNASINYSCNNVVFIEYYNYIYYNTGSDKKSIESIKSDGFDLNTGNKISLKDLFKNDSEYEEIINDKIYMEIIKNNYDDPDSAYMNKSFQGIRENQSFNFGTNNLKIILDEKNDEFNSLGYPNTIMISLKEIGDELIIFDKYFDKNINIFEKDRLLKLMPNQIEYKIMDAVNKYEDYYMVEISRGEFINTDPDIKTKLESLIPKDCDVDGFIKRAAEFNKSNPNKYYGSMFHNINLMMNSGGYMCMAIYTHVEENGLIKSEQKYINYDLNKNKIIELKDLFVDGFDYKNAIIEAMVKNNLNSNYSTINVEDADSFSKYQFGFGEDGIYFNLGTPNQDSYGNYLWIPYEDIGFENIAIFAENDETDLNN